MQARCLLDRAVPAHDNFAEFLDGPGSLPSVLSKKRGEEAGLAPQLRASRRPPPPGNCKRRSSVLRHDIVQVAADHRVFALWRRMQQYVHFW